MSDTLSQMEEAEMCFVCGVVGKKDNYVIHFIKTPLCAKCRAKVVPTPAQEVGDES